MNQTEEFRKNAPAPLAARSINLPTPTETVLSNGLKLVVVEDKRLPIASFRLAFRAGSATEPQDLLGLTSIMTAMLNEGTATRTSLQVAEEVERLGGSLGASPSADFTTVSASVLSIYANKILDLMADIVLHPSFPEKELELNKQNTLQNLQYQRSQPDFLANERAAAVIYGAHPYSRVSTTPEAVNALTRELLIERHRQTFAPNNALFVAVGDVNAAELQATIERLFGDWQGGEVENAQFAAPPERTARGIYVVDRPGSAQSNIILGNVAVARTSPDYFPLLVMNQILGAGASSRLFMNLREEKGYTYGAYSAFDMRRTAGTFEAQSEVRTDVTGASLKEFFYELERIRDERVGDEELRDARNYLTGIFPIRLETQEGLTMQIVNTELYNLGADYLATYRDKINAVTANDVQRVAQKYVQPEQMAIVIVGDGRAINEQIKSYADEIQYFDAAGNVKEMNENMAANGTAAGTWNLSVASPQGELPITMVLNDANGNLNGTLSTPLGDGEITGGSLNGDNLTATASLDFQGQRIEVAINGALNGDEAISGTVSVPIPGFPPLSFTGTKAV